MAHRPEVDNLQSAIKEIDELISQGCLQEAEDLASRAAVKWPDSAAPLVRRAALRLNNKRLDEAMADVEQALELDPCDSDALLLRVLILKEQQHFVLARQAVSQGLEVLPGHQGLLLERGTWLGDVALAITTRRLAGDHDGAIQILSEVFGILTAVLRGQLLFDLGDYPAVLETLDADPLPGAAGDDSTIMLKVQTLRQLDRFESAKQVLSDALTKQPDNIDFLTERGALLFDLGHYIEALDVLNDVLTPHPDHERALRLRSAALCEQLDLGMKSIYLQDHAAATTIIDDVLAREAGNEKALEMRALILRIDERFSEADAALSAALLQRPNNVRLLAERANLLFERSEYDEASGVLDNLLAVSPANGRAARMRAAIASMQATLLGGPMPEPEPLSDPRPAFDDAVLPDKAVALGLEVAELRRQRRFYDAEMLASRALARFPEHLFLLTEHANLLFETGQLDRLLGTLSKILQRDRGHEVALQMRVMTLRMQERFAEARTGLQEALAQRPVSIALLAEQGALLFDLGKYNQALQSIDRLLERFGRSEFGFKLKALALTRKGDVDSAQKCLRLGISQSVQEEDLYLELGHSFLREGQPAKAMDYFSKAAAFNPGSISSVPGIAEAKRKLGLFFEAEMLLDDAEKRFADDPASLARIAVAHVSSGNYAAARRMVSGWKQQIARRDLLLDMLLIEGFLLYQDGKLAEAERVCRETYSRFPNDPTARTNLAWTLAGLKGPAALAEGEAVCGAVLARNARNVSAISCRGVIAFARGDIHDSEHLLRSAYAYDNDSSAVSLAGLLIYLGQYDEAGRILDKHVERYPEDAPLWLERGKLMMEQKKVFEGLSCFRRALVINPYRIESIEGLALALFRESDLAAARQTADEGLKRIAGAPTARLHLILAQIELKAADDAKEHSDYTDALRAANQAVSSDPRLADAFFYQGLVRHRMGNTRGAIRSLKECCRLKPEHADAERDLKKLQESLTDERSKVSLIGGVFIGAIMVLHLVGMWVLFLRGLIKESTVLIMVPLLLGLVVVAFVLPYLIKLKFPGFEAELTRPTQKISGSSGAGLSLDPRPPSLPIGPR